MKLLWVLWLVASLNAETGYDAWLRYVPVHGATLPPTLVTLDDSVLMRSAREEMSRGVLGMLRKSLRAETTMPNGDCILLGNAACRPACCSRCRTSRNDWAKMHTC